MTPLNTPKGAVILRRLGYVVNGTAPVDSNEPDAAALVVAAGGRYKGRPCWVGLPGTWETGSLRQVLMATTYSTVNGVAGWRSAPCVEPKQLRTHWRLWVDEVPPPLRPRMAHFAKQPGDAPQIGDLLMAAYPTD